MVNTKKFPREYGHGRANYINGPRVAGARSLPAKSDQVISNSSATARAQRAPGPGLKNTIVWFFQDHQWKQRHASVKRQASSVKHHAPIFRKLSNQPVQASGDKRQAPGSKRQAPSHKRQAP